MELATIPNGNTNNIPTKKQSELLKSFSDARDKWKIDPNSLKGFYLHTETSNLYCWEQAQGILYLYNVENGDCTPIWSSANPGENAEIWTVLPLPPTDAAAQQQNKQEDVLSMMVEIPAGAVPGQAMHIISPEGQEVQFIVPENVEPGMMMAIQYQKPCDYLLLHVVEDENTEFNNHIDAEFDFILLLFLLFLLLLSLSFILVFVMRDLHDSVNISSVSSVQIFNIIVYTIPPLFTSDLAVRVGNARDFGELF